MIRFLLLVFIFPSLAFGQHTNEKKILQSMVVAGNSVKSSKFTLKSIERMENGKLQESEMIVKMETHPRKIYLFCVNPNAGTQALWKDGWLNNKLLINPSGFPFVNIHLSPYSTLVRKDTHHTVYELGFEYVSSMIDFYQKFYGDHFYDYLKIEDTLMWDNHKCVKLDFDFNDYSQVQYSVKPGENFTTIANKLHLNDYTILRKNPKYGDYDDVKAGDIISLPNFYCRRIIFYVDLQTWLPLLQQIYDEKGLYEQYEMKSYLNNPTFVSDEFDPTFKEYGF